MAEKYSSRHDRVRFYSGRVTMARTAKRIISVLLLSLLPTPGGIMGTPALRRELRLTQLVSTGDQGNAQFDVDASGIPRDWLEESKTDHGRYGEIKTLRIAPGNRVKLVLVPMQK
jgi:hypothetical protein